MGQRVGGDWFDAVPLNSGGVGFAIGDEPAAERNAVGLESEAADASVAAPAPLSRR